MNFWEVVEATAKVLDDNSRFKRSFHLDDNSFLQMEGIGAKIQDAARDWISSAFRDMRRDEAESALVARTEELYDSWVGYAEKIHGIYSAAAQQVGWEMIMDGHLLKLPGDFQY